MIYHDPIGGPQSPASGLAALLPPNISPKAYKVALADEIERMIDMLDALDGDPDLEPDLAGFSGAGDDREGDESDLEPSGDEQEPSLGSVGSCWNERSQIGWAAGAGDDREHDGDDLEPDVDDELTGDDEPSLGSPDRMSDQENWSRTRSGVWWLAGSDHEVCARTDFVRPRRPSSHANVGNLVPLVVGPGGRHRVIQESR